MSREATVVLAKVCEYFMEDLTLKSWHMKADKSNKTLERGDLEKAIIHTEEYDFLVKNLMSEEKQEEAKKLDTSRLHLGHWALAQRLIACINSADEPVPSEVTDVFYPSAIQSQSQRETIAALSSATSPDATATPNLTDQELREQAAFEQFDLFPLDGTSPKDWPVVS